MYTSAPVIEVQFGSTIQLTICKVELTMQVNVSKYHSFPEVQTIYVSDRMYVLCIKA